MNTTRHEGERLRTIRHGMDMTLHQMGVFLGVHWTTVWRWEHGVHRTPESVMRLAENHMKVKKK